MVVRKFFIQTFFTQIKKTKGFQILIQVKHNNKQAKVNQLFKSIWTFSNFPRENYRAIKIFSLVMTRDKSAHLLPHHEPAQQLRFLLRTMRSTAVISSTKRNATISLEISKRRWTQNFTSRSTYLWSKGVKTKQHQVPKAFLLNVSRTIFPVPLCPTTLFLQKSTQSRVIKPFGSNNTIFYALRKLLQIQVTHYTARLTELHCAPKQEDKLRAPSPVPASDRRSCLQPLLLLFYF